MEYSTFGRTGLRVSRLSLGAMTFGAGSGIWGEIAGLDRVQATPLVATAVDQGVNLIDTADAYSQGQSEVVVGQVLSDLGLDESRLLVATIIEMVLRIGAKAVVASPIRSFGILSALVLARELTNTLIKQHKRITQLEAKLSGIRVVSEAQDILCRQRGITKEEAYSVIREQAMSKRVTAEEIAAAIINSNEILSFKA